MLYKTKCPACKGNLVEEDIDYNFDGCQDEMSYCENCKIYFYFRIRYHKVCKRYTYSKEGEEGEKVAYL